MLINCEVCSGKVSKNAKSCPHCGEPISNIWTKVGGTKSGTGWQSEEAKNKALNVMYAVILGKAAFVFIIIALSSS